MREFFVRYMARHQHPANRVLHAIGLPVTFVLPVVWLVQEQSLWALGAFIAGYAMQFLGHAIEGSEAGELILLKRWLGRS